MNRIGTKINVVPFAPQHKANAAENLNFEYNDFGSCKRFKKQRTETSTISAEITSFWVVTDSKRKVGNARTR